MMELPQRKIHTVSELTNLVKTLLENEYPSVWIQGEISNFRVAPSGHAYFILKDGQAQIRCVMFRLQNQFLKFRPEDGLDIICWGRVTVYSARGEYQLVLDTMEPRGLGSLMLAFEQLGEKLSKEGLFEASRKRALPKYPRTVGLITSRSGAAIRDLIRVSTRRHPGIRLIIRSTAVQGDRAPAEITAALKRMYAVPEVDVIIVGRGGGSIEDLWAFNDEGVVRTVAASPVPIVSAVGHESDFTLTDFTADMRASTPSAAAELVVPDRRELEEQAAGLVIRLGNATRNLLKRLQASLDETSRRLYDPRRTIAERRQRIDELTMRLESAMRRRLRVAHDDARACNARLRGEHLQRCLDRCRLDLANHCERLSRSMKQTLKTQRAIAEHLISTLDSLSPLRVLGRGYSITWRSSTGAVLKDASEVSPGEPVAVRLASGGLACTVEETYAKAEDISSHS